MSNVVSVNVADKTNDISIEKKPEGISADKSDLQNVLTSLLKKTESVKPVKSEVSDIVSDNNNISAKHISAPSIFKPKLVDHLENKGVAPEDKDKVRNELAKMSAEVDAYFVDFDKGTTVNKGQESHSGIKTNFLPNRNNQSKNNTNHQFKPNHKHHNHQSSQRNHRFNHSHQSQENRQENVDNPLSPKKIEKKLKQPHHERSPFTS
ncbi:MAG: hypothetical protein UZ19_OD1000294 [Parcubacteria bacterium OLB19]|nr:MAG: hypothetical protein UZ19_OD1000294 [Parcubacteria bacterium OLB19]